MQEEYRTSARARLAGRIGGRSPVGDRRRTVPEHPAARWRSEAGQTLVIFALALPVLLGMAAIVVGFGNLFVEKRSLQKAADASALAAAQRLPGGACDAACQTGVATLAGNYRAANLGDGNSSPLPVCTVSITSNCHRIIGGARVEVILTKEVATFFGGLVGKSSYTVRARAVAAPYLYTSTTPAITEIRAGSTVPGATSVSTVTTTSGGSPALLFAYSTACDAVILSGANSVFGGAVVSNGGADAHSDGIGGDSLTYGDGVASSCLKLGGNAPLWGEIQTHAPVDWPVPIPTCLPAGTCAPGATVAATSVNGVPCRPWSTFSVTKPDLYCSATGISPPGGLAGFGFVAPTITAGGTYGGFPGIYPQYGGLLFYGYGSGSNVVRTSGSGFTFKGAIFAPLGEAQLTGSGSNAECPGQVGGCGFIEALTVRLAGANASWQGLGPGFGGITTTTTTTTTTPGSTTPGSTTIAPPVTSTTGTGSNLDE